MRFLKSVTLPNNVKGGPLGFFNNPYVAKYQKIEGHPLVQSHSFRKKLIVPKKSKRKASR